MQKSVAGKINPDKLYLQNKLYIYLDSQLLKEGISTRYLECHEPVSYYNVSNKNLKYITNKKKNCYTDGDIKPQKTKENWPEELHKENEKNKKKLKHFVQKKQGTINNWYWGIKRST